MALSFCENCSFKLFLDIIWYTVCKGVGEEDENYILSIKYVIHQQWWKDLSKKSYNPWLFWFPSPNFALSLQIEIDSDQMCDCDHRSDRSECTYKSAIIPRFSSGVTFEYSFPDLYNSSLQYLSCYPSYRQADSLFAGDHLQNQVRQDSLGST